MSRFKALLKYLGGIAAGAIIGFFSAKRKYGTGIIDILGGTTPWGGYEELGVKLFWIYIQAWIFFAIVSYVIVILVRKKTGKSIKDFFSVKF